MLVRKIFAPRRVVWYMRHELMFSIPAAVLVWGLFEGLGFQKIALPFSIAATLGGALAIFLGFRNNSSYGRWWEARTIWGSIINSSRIFARQMIANADNAAATGKATPEVVAAYKREMVHRQIAFAHALRLQLRGQKGYGEFAHLLPPAEFESVTRANNVANMLLHRQGARVKEAMRQELLGPFDNISIEPTLAGFNNWQGACERIKNTPLLRQYHYFTQLFLYAFMLLLPFCLIGDFHKMGIHEMMIPTSVLISFVFGTIAKIGEVNEDPFENLPTDVPLSAICNTIERDLKEMLGETDLPAKWQANNEGFLM